MSKIDNQIIIFKTEDEKISMDVRFDEETVWLTIDQMAMLFELDFIFPKFGNRRLNLLFAIWRSKKYASPR
jgi:hypothetical protein